MTAAEQHVPAAVSIIVAIHNGEEYLAALAEQLAALDFADYELVIVNDGSTDASGAALRRIALDHNASQYIELDQNIGVARARNLAVARACGEYIWFIDCDDRWEPGILRSLYHAAKGADASLVICGADLVSAAGQSVRQLERFTETQLLERGQLVQLVLRGKIKGYLWNKLFRRAELGHEPFPAMSSQSDLAGFIGVLPRLQGCLVINELLYHHVARPGSITTSKNPNLQNLVDCGHVMQGVLKSLDVDSRSPAARYFMTRVIRYSVCNTAYRLSERDPATTSIVRRMRAEITAYDVWYALATDKPAGAAVAMLKYANPVYRALLDRRWRRLRPTYFAGSAMGETSSSRFAT